MNHMNDPSTRKFVGSKNLWKQICDGDFTPEDRPPSYVQALGSEFYLPVLLYVYAIYMGSPAFPTASLDSRSPINRTWVTSTSGKE